MSSASARKKAVAVTMMATLGLAWHAIYKSLLLLSLLFSHPHFFFPKGRPRRTCSLPKFIRFNHMCETSQKEPRRLSGRVRLPFPKACDTCIMATLVLAGRATYKSLAFFWCIVFARIHTSFFSKDNDSNTFSPLFFKTYPKAHMCDTTQKDQKRQAMSSVSARHENLRPLIMTTLVLTRHAMYKYLLFASSTSLSYPTLHPRSTKKQDGLSIWSAPLLQKPLRSN